MYPEEVYSHSVVCRISYILLSNYRNLANRVYHPCYDRHIPRYTNNQRW